MMGYPQREKLTDKIWGRIRIIKICEESAHGFNECWWAF